MRLLYSVAELASSIGRTKYETLAMLRAQHVEMRRIGTKHQVTLAAIRNAWPELAQSLTADAQGKKP